MNRLKASTEKGHLLSMTGVPMLIFRMHKLAKFAIRIAEKDNYAH